MTIVKSQDHDNRELALGPRYRGAFEAIIEEESSFERLVLVA